MIWLQLITALFAVALAWLNKHPVNLMRAHWAEGVHKAKEREFHAANAVVKVLYVAAAVWLIAPPNWYTTGLTALLLLLIQWLVFDITLNLFTGKKWHYLGKTAMLDRMVGNGQVKAILVTVIIITLNLLL